MNIDKSKLKLGIWYEDEEGNRVESDPNTPEPVCVEGVRTYHHCFPLEITEKIYSYHNEEEKKNCKHKKKWLKKDTGLIKGLKGRMCTACGCSQTTKWYKPYGHKWNEGTAITHMVDFNCSIGGGNQDVIMAMVNSGDYTLAEALVVWSSSCERCMNVLAYKYLDGKDGYEEYSEEWQKCNTVCDFCREV